MKKRIISLLLVLVMVAAMLPMISLRANAQEVPSGLPVLIWDLKKGDIVRSGAIIDNTRSNKYTVNRVNSPDSNIIVGTITTIRKGSWTSDRNYYVVRNTNESLYLYPIPTTYITFDPNGGTAGGTTGTSRYQTVMFTDDNDDVSGLSPSRPGYNFLGWYIGNTQIYNANGITVNDGTYWADNIWQYNGSVTVTAKWKANTYTVSFNGNGATGGSTASQNFTYDVAQNLRANGFQQTYTVTFDPGEGLSATSGTATSTFNGWNTKADGSGTAYSNQQSVKNLTATDGATINLYAQWTPGSVTLPTPTKSGKVCTGWYTASGAKVGNCGDSYTPSGNITLYAKWETVGYTVTWKNYDGTVLETDEGVAQGATPTYDGATPTKPDTTEHSYIFSGWSPAISPVTGNVVYTAQFTETPRQYALSFSFDESKGQVTSNDKAPVGSVVTVDVLPNNGYGVKEIIAYKTGDKSTSVSIDSTSCSFTMPAFDVTVAVTWVESDVIYTSAWKDVEPTFTVTIPATVTLGNEITVTAENVRVNKGSQVVVSVADVSGEKKPFTMTSAEGYDFTYTITVDGTPIASGADVLTVNPNTAGAGTAVLKFERPKRAIYAGKYSGSVVFTITVQSVEKRY